MFADELAPFISRRGGNETPLQLGGDANSTRIVVTFIGGYVRSQDHRCFEMCFIVCLILL
jgi:hypothetical protein